MKLGVAIEDTWDFFREIYADFEANFETRLFARRQITAGPFHTRINKALFRNDMRSFLSTNDVVFFEWASELLVAASHMPKHCGIVTRLHRFELYKWTDHVNWDAVDRIIVVSHAKEREFASRYPAHSSKVVVASPSIVLDKFTLQCKPFTGAIGILCHMTPRKRVYDLILTFAEIADEDPRLHLHVAGAASPEYRDYYEALQYIVEHMGLQDRVTFYGNVKDTWNWYHNIDIFVSNSYSEGLQVAPMEAMASGCYTLSHHWAGAEELVPGANLFCTQRQLQAKLLSYCALSEREKESAAEAMRCWACEHFDISVTIQQIRQTVHAAAADWAQSRVKSGTQNYR